MLHASLTAVNELALLPHCDRAPLILSVTICWAVWTYQPMSALWSTVAIDYHKQPFVGGHHDTKPTQFQAKAHVTLTSWPADAAVLASHAFSHFL